MIFSTKKYLALLPFVFMLGGFTQLRAQLSDSVNITCMSVDSVGDVTLTWVLPPSSNLVADGWLNYEVFASKTGLAGSYISIASVPNSTDTASAFNLNPRKTWN